jgi:hypothetical protein
LLTGATDIGAGIADADLFLVDDGAGGTLRKTAASRIKTYIGDTGKILQVVGATDNTQKDTSATSYADTGLSASITPSSSSNKVLIIVHHGGLLKDSSNNAGKLQLLRGTTAIHMFENDFGRDGGTGLNAVGGSGTVHLDSPNTTSETTYKTQIACSVTAASTVRSGQNNAVATMTLMEVSA